MDYKTTHYIQSNHRLFIELDAFATVLSLTIKSKRKLNISLNRLDRLTQHRLEQGIYIEYGDIPESILNSLKLNREELISSLRIQNLNNTNSNGIRKDLIYEIIKGAIEKDWPLEWYRYSENFPPFRSIIYARKHVLFNLLIRLPFTYKEIYEATKSLFSESERYTYNYLVTKAKRIKTGRSTIEQEIIPNKGKVNNLKFKNTLIKKAEAEFSKEHSTYEEILDEVNSSARKLGMKQISLSTLKKHFSKPSVQAELRIHKNGETWYKGNIEAPIHLIKPKYRDELFEIDGSRVQIPYYDKDLNEVDYLSVFVILDTASDMVLGYACDQFENHKMVLQAFERMITIHRCLPRNITRDRAGHYNKRVIQIFKANTKRLGVNWRATSNASAKPYVESFFHYFARKICKAVPSYVGLGITCKNPDSRKERRRINKLIRNKDKLPSRKQLILLIDEFIEKYNNTARGNSKETPAELYNRLSDRHSITVSDMDFVRLFWKSNFHKVFKSEIAIRVGGNETHFQLSESNALKYHDTKIRYYYNDDLRDVYLFSLNGEFIEHVSVFQKINPAPSTRSNAENQRLNQYLKERNKRKQNLFESHKEREKDIDKAEAKIIPIELASSISYNKSKEYQQHREFTNKIYMDESKKSRRGNDIKIDKSRLYKNLD